MNKIWLICNDCGYNKTVTEEEVFDYDKCEICGGRMVVDINQGKHQEKITKENQAIGDNFPNIKLHNKELEEIYQLKNQKKISQEDIDDLVLDIELFCQDNTIILYKGRQQ